MVNMIRVAVLQGVIQHYRIPLYREVVNRGYEVTVIHSGDSTGGEPRDFEAVRVPVYRAGAVEWQSDVLRRVQNYDVVVANFNIRRISTALLGLRWFRRVPLVFWGIGFGSRGIARPVRIRLADHAQALLLYSEEARSEFLLSGVDRSKIFVAPNTVHVEAPSRRHSGDRSTILVVGTLDHRKRLDVLLRAFALASSSLDSSVRIVVIGDGESRVSLEALARDLGIIDRVEFVGRVVCPQTLSDYFAQALCSVSPGQAGLSVLSSFAHGVPFITSSNAVSGGEIHNIIHGYNGILFDGSEWDLSQQILKIAGDHHYSSRLGENALQYYLTRRTIWHMANGFESAITYALSSNGRLG